VTAFELNEELKERCVKLGASKAVTTFYKKGVPIIPETFYETIIDIPSSLSNNEITKIVQLVLGYKFIFDEEYEFTDPLLEGNKGDFRIAYAIFLNDKPFNSEINFVGKLP
jgi:hypothetical protein